MLSPLPYLNRAADRKGTVARTFCSPRLGAGDSTSTKQPLMQNFLHQGLWGYRVESRMISSVLRRTWRFGSLGFSIFSIRIEQACGPIWKPGWAMVVMGGNVIREVSILSKPMTESSSGTRMPKCWAALIVAAANTSEQVKKASVWDSLFSVCNMAEYANV